LDTSQASGGAVLFTWGNRVAGATLSSTRVARDRTGLSHWLLGDSTTLEQRASWSNFSTVLDLGAGSLTLDNRINDVRVSGDITAQSSDHDRSMGYELASYGISYDAKSAAANTQLYLLRQSPTSGALYVDDVWHANDRWLLETGLRGETFSGGHWASLSPRVSAKYFLTGDWALTSAVGRFTQWTHSLAREDVPIRLFDFWEASDATTPVSTAWHFIAGSERWLSPTRYARIEAFYKKYDHLLESNPQDDPNTRGDEFFVVNGDSYGLDVLLRQFEHGPFSGWISYTYAVAARTQGTLRYFPGHDRRHDVNVVASWRLKKYLLGLRYGYATGTPYTDIVAQIVRRVYDPGLNTYGTRGGGTETEFVGGYRNGARLPDTQRLDLDVSRTYTVRGVSIAPYLSVVNAYNAKNVFFYIFDYTASPPTREAISQFPLLPSAGVSIRF
jgi:hypothetical protein